jgi:transposase
MTASTPTRFATVCGVIFCRNATSLRLLLQRFSSIKKAVRYCGLCGDEQSSANRVQRTPLSKQRNKHLQTTLIEAAKMAPRHSPALAMLYDKEKQKGKANHATLAVTRKLVAYLMAVDRGQRSFLVIENEARTAA